MLNMYKCNKVNITNLVFSFLSSAIIPIAIFAPVGLWIPLLIFVDFIFSRKE